MSDWCTTSNHSINDYDRIHAPYWIKICRKTDAFASFPM